MAADLIHWMQSLFLPAAGLCQEASWHPSADVYRTPDGWLVKFDLAGVQPQDIEVQARGQSLRVRGTRRDACVTEGCRFHRMEIAYNHFERTVELPCNLETAAVATEYRDGMLLVRIS
jgi:HSP20 family protein